MSVSDTIIIPILLGSLIISTLIGWTILHNVDAGTTDAQIDSTFLDKGKDALMVFDRMIIFMVVSVAIGALALAASLRTHPVFAPISMLILAIFVMVSATLANVHYEIMSTTQLATAANELVNMTRVNENLPLIVAVLGIAIIIATYAKPWERANIM